MGEIVARAAKKDFAVPGDDFLPARLCARVVAALVLLFSIVSVQPAQGDDTFRIRIIYPGGRTPQPAVERIFVFGDVYPPTARVTVNGLDTPLIQTASGGWLAIIPVKEGKFKIVAKAVREDGSETVDTVNATFPNGAGVSAAPETSVVARPDLGTLAVHKLQSEKELRPPKIARIIDDTVFLRSGPDIGDEQTGYEMRLQKNVLVTLVGQVDKTYHVRLSEFESVWIDATAVALLPKNTPAPQSLINAWTVRRTGKFTTISVAMQELLPYRAMVSADGRTFSLKIYGGISNTDWVHYAADDPWIRHAGWSQPMDGIYQLDLYLRRPVWGYDVRYEYNRLVIEFRDPPSAPVSPEALPYFRGRDRLSSPPPLHGVRVAIDPGHPPLGTISPHGVAEHVPNWQIADHLRDALIMKGADVFMTRDEGETTPLPLRVVRSHTADADLFISIHTNALPPSENPFEKNGFGVYYFQPFSQPFAEAVHDSLRQRVALRDDGLHYGNLHVTRQTYVPSILVECGYLMWPPEADLLMDAYFQSVIAQALASGIETFVQNNR